MLGLLVFALAEAVIADSPLCVDEVVRGPEFFPDATVPGRLVNVDFMVKDSKRFADSGGWGYAVFDYDAASDTFKPGDSTASEIGLRAAWKTFHGIPCLPRKARRSTSEVLAHHLKCFAARDLDGLVADYSADALFLSPAVRFF